MRIFIGSSGSLLAAAALLASMALLSGCAGQAAGTSAAVAGSANGTSTDPGDQMICKAIASTGSRVKSRSCKTKSQWDAQQANTTETSNRFGAEG